MDSYTLARKRCRESNHETSKPILVLNLANPVHPGGGVRRGAHAQEEDLCRKSSLLVSLESDTARPYYAYNASLNTLMGSDAIILSPTVEIIKDEHGQLLNEPVTVAVLTCAAPMITEGLEGMTEQQYREMFYRRISFMLRCAASWGYRELILGAWGCGAFGNDSAVVSDLFYQALKELHDGEMTVSDLFTHIDFAVLCKGNDYNYRQFLRNFKDFYRDEHASEDDTVPLKQDCRPVLFWHEHEEYGKFSNWYTTKFVIDDFVYDTTEQYMMAQKAKLFHDAEHYTAILRESSPAVCKQLGRAVKPFDPDRWKSVAYEIVKTANRAKFTQNPELLALLLSTKGRTLAEASPKDKIWGIGIDASTAVGMNEAEWPGKNLLGKILMELRDELSEATVNK